MNKWNFVHIGMIVAFFKKIKNLIVYNTHHCHYFIRIEPDFTLEDPIY